MRRMLAVLVVAAAAVLGVTLLNPGSEPPDSWGPTGLQGTTLAPVSKPQPPPKARFVRTIFATSTLEHSELMLDFCKGPVAVPVRGGRSIIVAEHDYCGGLEWMPKLGVGDAIKLSGDGVQNGTYVVATITHAIRGKATVRDLPHTDIVLQTCVSHNTMVLVGMNLYLPGLQS